MQIKGTKLPAIRTSSDLRDHYYEISALCHENDEPVFITVDGHGADLVVLSGDAYQKLADAAELAQVLEESLPALEKHTPGEDALNHLLQEIERLKNNDAPKVL